MMHALALLALLAVPLALLGCGDDPPPADPAAPRAVGDAPADTTFDLPPREDGDGVVEERGGQPGLPGTPAPSTSFRTSGDGRCHVYARYVVAVRPRGGGPGEDVIALPREAGIAARALCDAPAGRATVALTDAAEPTHFAGLAGDVLLVDSGTGPSGRTLRAYDLAAEGRVVLDTEYEEPTVVERNVLVYSEPVEDYATPEALAATAADCPDAATWFADGFAVGVNRVVRFDLATRQAAPSDSLTCVPLQ